MAHSVIHFSAGMLIGALPGLPGLARSWRHREKLSGSLGRWLLQSYGTAFFAIVPSLLRFLGMPDKFCSGWWMNLFLLHPLLDRLIRGGTLAATASIIALPACQYAVLLFLIRQKLKEKKLLRGRAARG